MSTFSLSDTAHLRTINIHGEVNVGIAFILVPTVHYKNQSIMLHYKINWKTNNTTLNYTLLKELNVSFVYLSNLKSDIHNSF